MKKLALAVCCLVILSSLLMSQGHSPATLDEANVFTGANTIAHPGVYTGPSVHNALSVFLNGYSEAKPGLPITLAPATNAISVGGITPPNATAINVTGISTRMTSNCNASFNGKARARCNTVGGYFVTAANANGAGVWALNPIAYDVAGTSGTHVLGAEFDIGIYGTPAFVRGVDIIGIGDGTVPEDSIGVEVSGFHRGHPLWNRGIQVDDGTAVTYGLELGTTLPSGRSLSSLPLAFARYDSGAMRHTDVSLEATGPGDLVLAAATGRGVVVANGGMIGSGSPSNTDQNGQLTFSKSTTSNSYEFAGTYALPPICTITPLGNPVGQLYISTLTTKTLQLTDTSSVSITVDYHCFKRN